MASVTREANQPRRRLLDAAIELLAGDGPDALQARKVTAAAGTSTMGVYTHFGGMRELVLAMAGEGFRLLDAELAGVAHTDDAVLDLAELALAYRSRALQNPQLYRVMFGLTAPGGHRLSGTDLTTEGTPTDLPTGRSAFAHLVEGTRRAMEAGRLRADEPVPVAGQLWSALHGYVTLELSGYFGEPDSGLGPVLLPLLRSLVLGLGDDPAAAAATEARLNPGD